MWKQKTIKIRIKRMNETKMKMIICIQSTAASKEKPFSFSSFFVCCSFLVVPDGIVLPSVEFVKADGCESVKSSFLSSSLTKANPLSTAIRYQSFAH